MIKKKKIAVTLNETLVATALIGTISVLTLGTISNEVSERIMNNARVVFNNEVAVAVADMHANQELVGHKDQASFNEAFKKYFGLEEITNEEDVKKYFAEEYKDKDGNIFTPYSMTTSDGKTIKLENRAVTSKGVSFAYTYKLECNPNYQFSQDTSTYRPDDCLPEQETDSRKYEEGNKDTEIALPPSEPVKYSYVAKNEALTCIVGFYDINGPEGPNKPGEDIGIISEIPKDCKDPNYIPDEFGRCPEDMPDPSIIPPQTYCALTDMNCKVNPDGTESNKSLDTKSCQCVCKISSCPNGQTLNKETCTCGCDEKALFEKIGCTRDADGKLSSTNPYVNCEESAKRCAPVSRHSNDEDLCKGNKGIWYKDRLVCDCKEADLEYQRQPYYGLAKGDPNNYCEPKCISQTKNEAFDKQVRLNAQKELKSASEINASVKSTKPDTVTNGCWSCETSKDPKIEIRKRAENNNIGGFCMTQCAEVPEPDKYPYFDFHPVDSPTNRCSWTCNTQKLDEYVIQLNKHGKLPSCVSSAPALKAAQDQYPAAHSIGGGTSCTQCGGIRSAFNSNSDAQKFAGFLCTIDNNIKGKPFCSTFKQYGKGDYGISYVANKDKCSVQLAPPDYGKAPSSVIAFHCAGGRCYQTVFSYTKTPKPGTSNPNNNIAVPESFAKEHTNKNHEHSDSYWNNQKVCLKITNSQAYDPLAMNIGSNQEAYPSSGVNTKFPFKYNKDTNAYEDIAVKWQNENEFAFIVDRKFKEKGNQHVGYMLSDVHSPMGNTRYESGFAQLKAQYDAVGKGGNGDGLVSRDEFKDKLYIWKKSNNSYTPLTDFVFDINTWSRSEYNPDGSAKQNDGMIYDISGKYRRLIPVNSKPNCNNSTCLVYDGKHNANTEKWKQIDSDTVYYWMPVGTGNKNYQWNTWYKSDGVSGIPENTARGFKLYYTENNKWYEVKIYNITDIVFKSEI